MRAILTILLGIAFLTGCYQHKHTHRKIKNIHEEHHHYPKNDLSDQDLVIEQEIDLYMDKIPNKE